MKKITLSGRLPCPFLGAAFWSLNSPLVKYLSLDPVLICALRSRHRWHCAGGDDPAKAAFVEWMDAGLCRFLHRPLHEHHSGSGRNLGSGSHRDAVHGNHLALPCWPAAHPPLRFKSFLPVLVIFIGVVFFMCSGSDAASQKGNLIALTEGVFFALMTISSKKVAGKNPVGLSAVGNLFAGAAIFLFVPGTVGKMSVMTGLDWVIMLVLGVVQNGAGYAFYNYGIQKVSAQKASVIALWEMILGPVWVALFLKEYPQPTVLIGFVIILLGMLMDALLNSEAAPAEGEEIAIKN